MPKKKTVEVEPVKIKEEPFKVVSIALDKNSNLYGLTDNNEVVKYDPETKNWSRV